MSRKLGFFLSGVALFLLFILFSYLVHKNLFTHFDFNNTVRLQDHISRRFDSFFSFLSDIGRFEVVIIVVLALAGWLALRKKRLAAISMLGLFGGFHLIELYGKYFVNHPPPPHFMLRTQNLMNFPQFYVSSEFSYPSGHAGRAAFVCSILIVLIWCSKRLSNNQKIILTTLIVAYDLIMVVSRVYLGEHWSSDVIGGTILGLGFGLLTSAFFVGEPKSVQKPEGNHTVKKIFKYRLKLVAE